MKRKLEPITSEEVIPPRRNNSLHAQANQSLVMDDVEMFDAPSSSLANLTVLWGRQRHPVEVDLSSPLFILKAQIFALTQVVPNRQRLIYRGKIIKDETWDQFGLFNGCEIRMVGTNDVIEVPPEETHRAAEAAISDVPEKAEPKNLLPLGIKNFGNTCYINSVLHLIRRIPELRTLIYQCVQKNIRQIADKSIHEKLIYSMYKTFRLLENHDSKYEKYMKDFIDTIDTLYPEYKGSIETGGRPQQDANEFYTRMINILKKEFTEIGEKDGDVIKSSFIDRMFGIEFHKITTCSESPDEEILLSHQTELSLSCFISNDVKSLIDGIKQKFKEEIMKFSQSLQRDAKYSLHSRISRLPPYLCVQVIRFFYKEKEKINAKILKDVKFQIRMDISELCTPELNKKIEVMRSKVREFETKVMTADSDQRKELIRDSEDNGVFSLSSQGLPCGECGSGIYNLIGILTHQGRSTSSGHYVSWIKVEGKTWAKMDDQTVTLVDEDDILKLSGGGEFHSAYLLIYQAAKILDNKEE